MTKIHCIKKKYTSFNINEFSVFDCVEIHWVIVIIFFKSDFSSQTDLESSCFRQVFNAFERPIVKVSVNVELVDSKS